MRWTGSACTSRCCRTPLSPTLRGRDSCSDDACLEIMEQMQPNDKLERIAIAVPPLTLTLTDRRSPKTPFQAMVSIHHWAASVFLRRAAGITDLGQDWINDPTVASGSTPRSSRASMGSMSRGRFRSRDARGPKPVQTRTTRCTSPPWQMVCIACNLPRCQPSSAPRAAPSTRPPTRHRRRARSAMTSGSSSRHPASPGPHWRRCGVRTATSSAASPRG
jgi:hypothetical protein